MYDFTDMNSYIQMIKNDKGSCRMSTSDPLAADEKTISEDEIMYPMVLAGNLTFILFLSFSLLFGYILRCVTLLTRYCFLCEEERFFPRRERFLLS